MTNKRLAFMDDAVLILKDRGENIQLAKDEKEIALQLLETLEKSNVTVSRAKEILRFCSGTTELISHVGR